MKQVTFTDSQVKKIGKEAILKAAGFDLSKPFFTTDRRDSKTGEVVYCSTQGTFEYGRETGRSS